MTEATRKRLLEPGFRYVPASATDIRKLFAKVKDEQQAAPINVKPLKGQKCANS